MHSGLRAAILGGHNFDAAVMAWDLKRSKAEEEERGWKGGEKGRVDISVELWLV